MTLPSLEAALLKEYYMRTPLGDKIVEQLRKDESKEN